MSDQRALEIVKQAIAELYHCVEAGPAWFTKGATGQLMHAREWSRRGMEAITELEQEGE